MFEVNTDLMRATGVQGEVKATGLSAKGLNDLVVGDGLAPMIHDRHGLPLYGVTCNWRFNPTTRMRHETAGNSQIVFGCCALGKLFTQALVGGIGFGHDKATTGILIQAVDNPGPGDPANATQASLAMMQYPVYQGAGCVPGCRMNNQARRLVNDQDDLVLKEDIKGHGFRDQLHGGWWWRGDGNPLASS